MKIPLLVLLLPLALLQSCIGTDIVDDPILAERLTISPRIDSIQAGEEVAFAARFTNQFGVEEAVSVSWTSSDTSQIRIDAEGRATGIANGPATIYATAATASDSLVLNTGGVSNAPQPRSGTFVGSGRYSASGTATIAQQADGRLHLSFDENFVADAGPNLFVILANHTNGSYAVSIGGAEINGVSAQVTPERLTSFSGAMDWTLPDGIQATDYDFVVLYCTLGPVFAHAELN